jgi:putative amidoligase enzyme
VAFSNTRTFGVEIELYNVSRSRLVAEMNNAGFLCSDAGYTHATTSYWKVVTDSSVKGIGAVSGREVEGCELVSPVLKGEEGLKTLAAVFALLNRLHARVNTTCGFHVHVGADGMDLTSFRKLAQVYVKYEAAIDQMVRSADRRAFGNTYCKSLRAWDNPLGVIAQIEKCDTIEQIIGVVNPDNGHGTHDRYRKLNLTAFWRHNTVEFRQKEGTMNALEAINWVRFCVSLVDGSVTRLPGFTHRCWSMKVTPTGADKWEKLFCRYIHDRRTSTYFRPRLGLTVEA